MTTLETLHAGNVVQSNMLFDPEGAGTVALADVTVRLRKADGTEVAVTGVTTTGTNAFEVEWASADSDITGRYVFRWESNAPSPKIVIEGVGRNADGTRYCTAFNLIASQFVTP